jgi:hypothetical protein
LATGLAESNADAKLTVDVEFTDAAELLSEGVVAATAASAASEAPNNDAVLALDDTRLLVFGEPRSAVSSNALVVTAAAAAGARVAFNIALFLFLQILTHHCFAPDKSFTKTFVLPLHQLTFRHQRERGARARDIEEQCRVGQIT